MRFRPVIALALGIGLAASQAHATTLSGNLTASSLFTAFISTDDTVLGTQISSGTNWPTTYSLSTVLAPNAANYLHIIAEERGGADGFIGTFFLDNADFKFSNGTQTLVTDTTNWKADLGVFSPPWVAPSGTPQSNGLNGGANPFGFNPNFDNSAAWIWSNPDNGQAALFSTVISPNVATPLPATLPLFATGLAGLGWLARRRRKQAA